MSKRAPVLFLAHGNPMNAVRSNAYTQALTTLPGAVGEVRALAVVSAHWEEAPIAVSTAATLETIHDFFGFPDELYGIQYPARGAPREAERAARLLEQAGYSVRREPSRGLDHGAWTPLRHAWPEANLPVFQISLRPDVPLETHLAVGRALAPLRDDGILLLGSGNLVHNLRTVDFAREAAPVVHWAARFDAQVKEALDRRDDLALSHLLDSAEGRQAHPTSEHFAPILVVAGAAADEAAAYPYEGFEHATASMRCVRFG